MSSPDINRKPEKGLTLSIIKELLRETSTTIKFGKDGLLLFDTISRSEPIIHKLFWGSDFTTQLISEGSINQATLRDTSRAARFARFQALRGMTMDNRPLETAEKIVETTLSHRRAEKITQANILPAHVKTVPVRGIIFSNNGYASGITMPLIYGSACNIQQIPGFQVVQEILYKQGIRVDKIGDNCMVDESETYHITDLYLSKNQ